MKVGNIIYLPWTKVEIQIHIWIRLISTNIYNIHEDSCIELLQIPVYNNDKKYNYEVRFVYHHNQNDLKIIQNIYIKLFSNLLPRSIQDIETAKKYVDNCLSRIDNLIIYS